MLHLSVELSKEYLLENLKKTEEFKALKTLNKNGVLSNEEFSNKTNALLEKFSSEKNSFKNIHCVDKTIRIRILNEELKFKYTWGRYVQIEFEFENGTKGIIFKGQLSQQYFYIDKEKGVKYFKTMEESICEYDSYLINQN